jgi:hypothetical protein
MRKRINKYVKQTEWVAVYQNGKPILVSFDSLNNIEQSAIIGKMKVKFDKDRHIIKN